MEGKVCDIWAQIILILMEQLRLICSDYPTIIASNLNIVQFPHQLDTVWSVCLALSLSLQIPYSYADDAIFALFTCRFCLQVKGRLTLLSR